MERGRATRQRLLRAAVALVGEVGWNGVTTRLVAKRADVSPGVVHYHYASVTDLLIAACTEHGGVMLEQISQGLVEQEDLADGVTWLLGELASYPADDPAALLLAEAFLASSRLPELRADLAVLLNRFRVTVAEWLRAHGYEGDADVLAVLLSALLDGVALHRGVDPGLDPQALAVPLRRLFASEPQA
ncbi:TetR/AcrR family transcriptional regulator [Streptosporangium sp. KLBMP 9127]|nr:TetR/AcrR family transcriptional regulator [Streptosporangium sp. KLBMP 9127]